MSCSASTRKIGFPASLVILLLVATVGFMFTLKSKLRIGTEVIVTFPPERVVAAIAPMGEHAPPIASATKPDLTSEENRRFGRRPLFRAGA